MKSMVKNPWSRECPKCLHREEIMKALCKRLGVLVLLAMAGCVSEPEPVGGGPYVNKPVRCLRSYRQKIFAVKTMKKE